MDEKQFASWFRKKSSPKLEKTCCTWSKEKNCPWKASTWIKKILAQQKTKNWQQSTKKSDPR